MNYIPGNNIESIFPSVRRGNLEGKTASKQMLEQNVVALVDYLLDKRDFVQQIDGNYIIRLHGYLFVLKGVPSTRPLYVGIEIDSNTGELLVQQTGDIDNTGLRYSSETLPTPSIQVLDNKGNVPESSKLKYDIENLFCTDDGTKTKVNISSTLLSGSNMIDGGTIGTIS